MPLIAIFEYMLLLRKKYRFVRRHELQARASGEVEMSDEEIEQKMDDNGYKKVTKEETKEVERTTAHINEGNGPSNTLDNGEVTLNVIETKKMFVTKDSKLQNVKSKDLYTAGPSKVEGPRIKERIVVRKTYDYNNKGNNKQIKQASMNFGLKVIKTLMDLYYDSKN